MNNTFNIQRFGLLLKRQWLEFGKIYLISLVVLLGIFLTFYGFTYNNLIHIENLVSNEYGYGALTFRIPLFCVTGLLFVTLMANSYFSHLGQKSRAIVDLLTPASIFEKFLGGIFFTSIVAIVSFLGLFYLTDLIFTMKIRDFIEAATGSKLVEANRLGYFFAENNPNEFKALYIVPFFISSIFLLGSVYFDRFHYIKTTICVMIFSGVWAAIIAKSAKVLFEGKIPIANENARHYFNQKDNAEVWITLLVIVLTLIFWSITYVRLKEKEV